MFDMWNHEGPPVCFPVDIPPWPQEKVFRCDPFQLIGLDYSGLLYVSMELNSFCMPNG